MFGQLGGVIVEIFFGTSEAVNHKKGLTFALAFNF
jgi:hypothetical protein